MFASLSTYAPIAAAVVATVASAALTSGTPLAGGSFAGASLAGARSAGARSSGALRATAWGSAASPVSEQGEWKAGVEQVTASWARTLRGTYVMRFDVALKPGWHTYWQNPGDSGSAPKFTWKLPEGWTANAVQYPRPEAKLMDGLPFFGYETSATYIVEVAPAAPAVAAATASPPGETWSVNATILVCKDICVRGSFNFEGAWPPAAGNEPVALATERFNDRALPRAAEAGQVTALLNGQTLVIEGPAQGESTVRFVPESAPGLGLTEAHEDVGLVTGKVEAGVFRVEVPLVRTAVDATGRLPDAAGIVLLGDSARAPHYAIRVAGSPIGGPAAPGAPPAPDDAKPPRSPSKQPSGS